MKLKGVITALVTPFVNQQLNEEGLAQNIHYQMAEGINGILLLGSTGESATLTPEEHSRIISIGVSEVKGRVPVLVGTDSSSTQMAIEKTHRAKDLGADIALIITPYFNKPSQEGIYRHFEAIAKQVDMPIIVYNHPGRSVVNIEVRTLMRIMDLPGIIGVKEASENMLQMGDLLAAVRNKKPEFSVFSGDDPYTYPLMAMGACGVISVASNLFPAKMVKMVDALLAGKFEEALEMHFELLPFFKAQFIETNPAPIKEAMNLCGLPAGACRLPLYQMKQENIEQLSDVLKKMNAMQRGEKHLDFQENQVLCNLN
jgi:4-hydroxy-tetrahydrodipicolinate synthase